MSTVDVTFLCCTFNRAADLAEMLDSVLAQEAPGRTFEILIVDNNSTDATGKIAADYVGRYPVRIRYLFESRKGKSFALNSALPEVRGNYYQIADDDLIFPPDYLARTMDVLSARPALAAIGGRVVPLWSRSPGRWLSSDHYAALALTAYGDLTLETGSANPLCLLAGCYRTEAVKQVGGYQNDIAVTANRVGGIEDADLFQRMYTADLRGRYVPELSVFHKVEPYRVEKRYHRRWHRDHGTNFAKIEDPRIDTPPYGPWHIPRYMYRELGEYALRSAWARLRGDEEAAFIQETRWWFTFGFMRERVRIHKRTPN